jgi:hypothetical protein
MRMNPKHKPVPEEDFVVFGIAMAALIVAALLFTGIIQ